MEISERATKILFTILFIVFVSTVSIFISTAHAAYVKCWSDNTVIYKGYVHDVRYTDEVITFIDKHKKPVFVFGNCVVHIDDSDKLKGFSHATEKGKVKKSHERKHQG